MKCPRCNVEMRINSSGYVMKDGKLYKRLGYVCRNKDCTNYGQLVKNDYIPLEVTEDPQAEVEESE